MNLQNSRVLKSLTDHQLLAKTKMLVQQEREVLTDVLHHLQEINQRRLYSELGYKSLFDYAVKELKYSEGQAGRRIQAAKLISEIPEVEEKITIGSLSLSNICQAQNYFRECKKNSTQAAIKPQEKKEILQALENKSSREGLKILIQKQPLLALPKEEERPLSDQHTEVSFVMNESLKEKLEELRSLLGPQGAVLNMAELINKMTELSIESLKIKKFAKKRVQAKVYIKDPADKGNYDSCKKDNASNRSHDNIKDPVILKINKKVKCYDNNKVKSNDCITIKNHDNNNIHNRGYNNSQSYQQQELLLEHLEFSTPARRDKASKSKNPRYISPGVKYHVWHRDKGQCTNCSSRKNLNYEHVQPIALGGRSTVENLKLLCFSCNQRQAIKVFGHVYDKREIS